MNTNADQKKENKSKFEANDVSQMQTSSEPTFEYLDTRPEAIAQMKLQEMANNSSQVSQLQSFQEIANNSSQTRQVAQLQAMADTFSAQQSPTIQRQENNTGLPDNLKTGMENLSGLSMDDVKVHRNSDKPAQLNAHAYAQGTDIHLASGQEKHLPHELGHVVQQKQGRVKPTMQMKGKVAVNDDAGLEKEADIMGAKAITNKVSSNKKVNAESDSSSYGIQLKALIIQRAPVDALIVESTRLKKNENVDNVDKPKAKQRFGSSYFGDKLKPGKVFPDVDFEAVSDGFYQTKFDGQVAWLDMTKTINKELTNQSVGALEAPDGVADDFADSSDLIGGVTDGIENTWLKGVHGEGGINSDLKKGSGATKKGADDKFGDLANTDKGIATAKESAGFAASSLGTIGSLWGMKTAAQDYYKEPSWKAFAEGTESLGGAVTNSVGAVDSMAKALGNKDGAGKSDIVGKYTGAINDGVSSVKNAFTGFTGLWKLYNSPSNSKGKDALVSTMQITKAALDAAKVAKSAYDIIGNGIPSSLIDTIPGLSITVSAINLIIRFADAWQAGDIKNEMGEKSRVLRNKVALSLGEVNSRSENIFREETRGIWPSYKPYYRIQPGVLPAIDKAYEAGTTAGAKQDDASTSEGLKINKSKEAFNLKVEKLDKNKSAADSNSSETSLLENKTFDLLKSNNGLITKEYTLLYEQWKIALGKQDNLDNSVSKSQNDKNVSESEMTSLPDKIIEQAAHTSIDNSSLKANGKKSLKGKVTGKDTLKELKKTSDTIREYQVIDKMAEINQKRKVSGYSDVAKEMVKISADIVTLSGVGAIVGASMKTLVAAQNLAHAGAKGVLGYSRDKDAGEIGADGKSKSGGVDKSGKQKHKEYVQHTQHIFRMLSATDTEDRAKEVLLIIKATGVNTGMMFSLNNKPQEQANMMVEAMKKRN